LLQVSDYRKLRILIHKVERYFYWKELPIGWGLGKIKKGSEIELKRYIKKLKKGSKEI